MIDATDPVDLLRQRNPIPPGSLYEAAAEQAVGLLAKLRTDDRLDPEAGNRALSGLTRRRRGRRRLVLTAVAAVLVLLAAAGVAAGTGVLPGWKTEQAIVQSPFMTATDPAVVPGSTVRLSVPGPESATLEIVTNNTQTVGKLHEDCAALVATDAEGRPIGGLADCGVARQIRATGGSSGAAPYEWRSPSGVTYAVFYGQAAVPSAAKVALVAGNGVTVATGAVERGYFLVYAPAQQAVDSLVFSDASGHVVDSLAADISAPRPCTSTAPQGPCG